MAQKIVKIVGKKNDLKALERALIKKGILTDAEIKAEKKRK